MATLIAAPIVRQPISQIGAPGMTDFVRIFLGAELNAPEYRTVLRHEQAHIWALHNMRRPRNAEDASWRTACELEIARAIYDDEDIATIEAPRSRLESTFLPNTIPDLPTHLCLAEDIYDWLIAHPPSSLPLPPCICHLSPEPGQMAAKTPPTMRDIRQELDKIEAYEKSTLAAKEFYRSLLLRPPTLVEAIDAALRVRVVPESSYRRPSRRETPGLILRGSTSIPRPPRVEIYIDRSASFTPEKTAAAETKLRDLLSRYGASIYSDVWYFGSNSLSQQQIKGGGNTPYLLIAQNLRLTQPRLAIIITDDDPCPVLPPPPKCTQVVCVPVGAANTNLAINLNGRDVR